MNNKETKELRELVKILQDSADFYSQACSKVKDTGLRATFNDIAATKKQLVSRLQPLIIMEEGEAEDSHNVAVKLRQLYTNILASMQSDKEETFISNLEEVEDKTRQKAHRVLDAASTAGVTAAMQDVYPDIKLCHDEMSRLKSAHCH